MRFEVTQRFTAPADAVAAAYADSALYDRFDDLPNARPPTVDRIERDTDVVRTWVRWQFAGEVNSTVRRFVDPDQLVWVEATVHDLARRTAVFEIVPDRYGSLLSGKGRITLVDGDDGAGCRRVARCELSVHVPLLGGKAERAIADGLRRNLEAQTAHVERHIADTGP